jgi:hypothetical protein
MLRTFRRPRAFGKRAPGRLSPGLVVRRVLMAAAGGYVLVAGVLTGSVAAVAVGSVFVILEAGILLFQALAFRPSRWPGGSDELLAQVADAALLRLGPPWRYDLETRDGFGSSGLRVATFSHATKTGPVLWLEDSITFRVTHLLRNGDEVSAEIWRNFTADHVRLVDILVALCEGKLTQRGRIAVVEMAKPVKLPIYPATVLNPG